MSLPKRDLNLLKANSKTKPRDIKKAEKLDKEDLQTAKKDEIIRIRELIREVGREIHMMKGFVRFKLLGDKVQYGYMKPEHEIGFKVANWFAKRFPGKIIVLGNEEESWISIYSEEGISKRNGDSLENTIDELHEHLDIDTEKDHSDLWENYYESQYSEQRKNKELFKKNMPEKYRKRAKNTTERKFKSKDLDGFA